MGSTFTMDPSTLAGMLMSTNGMVGTFIQRKTDEVTDAARAEAPERTGKLRASIDSRVEERGEGPVGIVSANVEYAMMVQRGTGPHLITPNVGRVLRFPSSGGGVIFRPQVQHPGTAPNEFLTRALQAVFS